MHCHQRIKKRSLYREFLAMIRDHDWDTRVHPIASWRRREVVGTTSASVSKLSTVIIRDSPKKIKLNYYVKKAHYRHIKTSMIGFNLPWQFALGRDTLGDILLSPKHWDLCLPKVIITKLPKKCNTFFTFFYNFFLIRFNLSQNRLFWHTYRLFIYV